MLHLSVECRDLLSSFWVFECFSNYVSKYIMFLKWCFCLFFFLLITVYKGLYSKSIRQMLVKLANNDHLMALHQS